MEHQTDLINEPTTFEKRPYDYDTSLNGLGGWMILIIIGRVITILLNIKEIADIVPYLGLNPEADLFFYIIISIDILLGIVLTGAMLFFIFKRNILFRKLMVIQIAVSLAITFIVCILFNSWAELSIDIFTGIVSGAIWITYLYRSVRVKNTFIYAHNHYEDDDI